MSSAKPCLLTVNGGSSSIKFARYQVGDSLTRIDGGKVEGIGLTQGSFAVSSADETDVYVQPVVVADYTAAIDLLMEWFERNSNHPKVIAIGHRLVHGGPKFFEPQCISPTMIAELKKWGALDPQHLPGELLLVDTFTQRFPDLPQIACFDTAFHQHMPAVAQRLAIPHHYAEKGLRRFGFHGLSCTSLMQELAHQADAPVALGRVLLAHLGNGASVTAVRDGKSIDTSMGFTPNSGLPMSNRSGDIDPGLAYYFAQTENMNPTQFQHMINQESGLLGISEISSDMRELLLREVSDKRAAEAVAMFCYHTKRWICSLTGALEGLDTLVFSGGIGENLAEVRARICSGLGFIGIELHPAQNATHAAVISSPQSRVVVRVIRTDEERVIAQNVVQVLNHSGSV